MNGSFEGDLIRPLGLVTLYFGYLEAEVNELMSELKRGGVFLNVSPVSPLGTRITELISGLQRLQIPATGEVLGLLEGCRALIDKRNALVHASILAGGKAIRNDPDNTQFSVTPEGMTALANQAFEWKEHLHVAFRKGLLPALQQGNTP